MNSKKYRGPCNLASSRSDVLIDKALITAFQVLPKRFFDGNRTVDHSVSCGKDGIARMNNSHIGAHPISIEAVYFASEYTDATVAISWRACGLGGSPIEAHRLSFLTHLAARCVVFT